MRRNCIFALLLVLLLSGCGQRVISQKDEDFQAARDEAWSDFREQRKAGGNDGFDAEKKHYYQVLDGDGALLYTVDRAEGVEALDGLFSDDENLWEYLTRPEDGEIACTYCYWQERTPLAGEDPGEERACEELVRFTVYRDRDLMSLRIFGGLEDLNLLPGVNLQDVLTFTFSIPAEAAETLRDPAQFVETE